MLQIKPHQIAAFLVFAAAAAWVATGEFSSVGSASAENGAPAPKTEEPAVLRTVAAVRVPHIMHARAIRVSGQTAADKRAQLAIRAGGIVEERPVEEGQRIAEGDLIVALDAAAKRAAVATAQQVLVQRESEAKAIEKLAKAGSIPKLQLDNALSALAAAKSQLEAAQSELSALEVRAPFAGVVDRLDVEKGSSVLAGSPVAILLALDPILAVGEVSESDLRHIENGDKADVRLVSGQVFSGAIRYISREATSATRTFRVEISAPNPEDRIPAGMTAEVTIFADEVDAVILPRSVVTLSGNGDLGIRYVDAADKVAFQPIDLIDDTPEGLVLTGIPADARIIVIGQDLVAEGDIVRVVEPDLETLRRLAGDLSGSIR